MTVVKNLGQIQAVHVGLSAPINTKILWYDDNTGIKQLKYYDTFLSIWKLLTADTTGLWDDRGNYDASSNLFPSTGGSGTAGVILKGDIWTVSVAGTLGGTAVAIGDTVRALTDTPGQTSSNWAIGSHGFGYVPLSNVLADGNVFVGNSSNVATARTLSGDLTITNTGVATVANQWKLVGNTLASRAVFGSTSGVFGWDYKVNNVVVGAVSDVGKFYFSNTITDSSAVDSLNTNTRIAKEASAGVTTLDWNLTTCSIGQIDGTGNGIKVYDCELIFGDRTLKWNTGQCYDGDPAMSLNWFTRTLQVGATNIASWSSATTGIVYSADFSAGYTSRSLIDKGYVSSTYLALAGGTMSGNIAMGGHNLTGVSIITGDSSTLNISGDTISIQPINTLKLSGNFSSEFVTLNTAALSSARTVNFPDAAGTFVYNNNSAALTNKTYNGLTVTTTTGTFTLTNGKVLSVSNTLTFTGTDSSSVNFGAGGTVLYSGGLGQWTGVDSTNIYFAGEVGIGTGFPGTVSTPTEALHLDNGTNNSIALKFTSGSNTANGTRIGIDGQGNAFFSVRDATRLDIATNDTTRQSISSLGLQTFTQSSASSGTTAFVTFTQAANTGGSAGGLLWTAGAHTSQTTATDITDINYNLSAVLKQVDGTTAVMRGMLITGRTYTPQTTALTVTTAVTLDVVTSIAGFGTTIGSNYAIRADGNINLIGGNRTLVASNGFTINAGAGSPINLSLNSVLKYGIGTDGNHTFTNAAASSGTTSMVTFTQPVNTGGSLGLFLITAGASTSQTTATNITDINFNLGAILKQVDGTTALMRGMLLTGRTYTPQTTALTVTIASTLDIVQSLAGSGTTIGSNYTQRWLYDTSNYMGITISSTGSATIALVGTSPTFTFANTLIANSAIQTSTTTDNSNFYVRANSAANNANTNANLLFAGATTIESRTWMRGSTNFTPAAGNSYSSFIVGTQAATIAGSGTHALFANMVINPVSITAGAGTLTNSASLYIQDAATGATNNYALLVNAGLSRFNGNIQFQGSTSLTVGEAWNLAMGTTTGSKIGTATSQKLSFWNATPIIQPTTGVAAATFVANTSGITNDTATFDGYTIGQVVKALRNTGLLA